MLVYPQRRPPAMRFHCFQSKRLQSHLHFCLILSLSGTAMERYSPTDSGWVLFFKKNATSFKQFSIRRQAKGKRGFPNLWSPNTFRQRSSPPIRHPAICNRPQHSQDLEGRPFRLQQVRGAAGDIGFSQNEFSSSDYIACISFFECQKQTKAKFSLTSHTLV